MVSRSLTLAGGGDSITLESDEFVALQGASGFGWVPQENRWITGSGHGSVFDGSRATRRTLPLPVLLRAPDTDALEDAYGRLVSLLDVDAAPARLTLDEGTRGAWWCDVVRHSGGDPVMGRDTNGHSYLALEDLVLEAGDPCWTSVQPVAPVILRLPQDGRGLLSGTRGVSGYGTGMFGAGAYGIGVASGGAGWSLTALRQKSGQALGQVILDNPGGAPGILYVVLRGPATYLGLHGPTRPDGTRDSVEWSGNLLTGETRIIDMGAGTVTDGEGANRYAELDGAPVFWRVPRGRRTVDVQLEGGNVDTSSVTLTWFPRRWVVIP